MRISVVSLVLVASAASAAAAEEPQPKLVLDLWDAAYLQGSRAGYIHTYVHAFEKDNVKLLRATTELRLTVLRSGETIQLGMDAGTYETADGKVVGTFLKQLLGKSKTVEITGVVEGNKLRLTLDKTRTLRAAPWNPEVVGLARQQRLFHEHKLRPGSEFSYRSFEPSVNLVIKTNVRARDFEEVDLAGSKQKKRLLRIESKADKIEIESNGAKTQYLQLPTLVSWLGDDLEPVRAEAEIPPFGRITLYRTTKAAALSSRPAVGPPLTDIGTSQYVKLAKRIANPYQTTGALYRITIRDEEDPASVFAHYERQQVKKIQGKTVELYVAGSGQEKAENKEAASEYTQSSYFINCADARVKSLARKAVGEEADPWKKALRIEKWVNVNMKVTSDEVLSPADHVARTLAGDCTEFAMLTAAMCRAEGIPSRTAVGLIYADVRSGPVFAFHMWTEVWFRGAWLPLDATLGKGQVGATHLKIRDQSWHDVYDQAPLLPVFRILGKISIEVVRIEGR